MLLMLFNLVLIRRFSFWKRLFLPFSILISDRKTMEGEEKARPRPRFAMV